MSIKKFFQKYGLYIAWTQALIAMLGSLYFSEILNFPPCVLCWYQRICLYPLVAILAVGIILKDNRAAIYALPLTIVGQLISLFHVLLYYNILPEAAAPCVAGISCTTQFIHYFGFVTIPLLSFLALAVINTCLIGVIVSNKKL
jgi:disulfide bond formation protein DsbB